MKILAALFVLLPWAALAAPVTVLGMPLGGKLPYTPSSCPINTDKIKKVCWVGTPYAYKDGTRLGMAALPDADSRPKWAAYSTFEIALKKDLTLTEIKVRSEGIERSEIYQSISSRFGPPWHQSGIISAKWDREDVVTDLSCASITKCWTTFRRTPTDDDLAKQAAAKSREKVRPISP